MLLGHQGGCCYETGFCIELITFFATFGLIHGVGGALI